ncbi:peptidase M14 [Salinimonas marina]|uniref:Peptidase M14 n=1 Tax=Salinimonas marina TaxID=2785918 RepID=A0A7S9DX61_9ALTE|nr:M14 metallopeptidase family protein [Salinimonas marina]QPG05604.1 peptidase M14 [Salinimonas marina]
MRKLVALTGQTTRRFVVLLLSSLTLLAVPAIAMSAGDTPGGRPAASYLPANTTYNPDIPTPEAYLGANVGEWHVRHDQLVGYMRELAQASARVSLQETGRTHENRPLLLLTITAPENHANLETLRQQHMRKLQQGEREDNAAPLVLYMGYSIHGNEPSGANAALLVAYYLSAGNSPQVDALLQDNIVLLDPSFNPDGLSRFAQWANMHKGQQLVADPAHREHIEGWPSGRTNHYWFDLNRDWLLLTHPESRARIKQFQRWRPHVLTDFHEMGPNSTYFFQPGVPSRKNPNTPKGNVTLTEALATYHVEALDKAGQLYFSEEGFDDFYYGKGSSYPDSLGTVGILFEQASSRGHLQDTINGPLAFTDTIANQVTTSLSTFAGALANKPALLAYQQEFAQDTAQLIEKDSTFGFVIEQPADTARFSQMLSLLEQHNIEYQWLGDKAALKGHTFKAGKAVLVPLNQPAYRLIKSLFSTRQSFADNTFYDVSNWNLPLAFNLTYEAVSKGQRRRVTLADSAPTAQPLPQINADAYAYAIDWRHYYAPALLQSLLEEGVQVRSTPMGFSASLVNGDKHSFAAGTMIISTPLAQPDNLVSRLQHFSKQHQVPVYSISSGFTASGPDLGSRDMVPVNEPKVLIVGGAGTREYEVGEIWHYLDTRVGLAASIVEQQRLQRTELANYTHIIFASGNYSTLREKARQSLERWVKQGGTLIGMRTALKFFEKQQWLDLDIVDKDIVDDAFSTEGLKFGDQRARQAKKIIAGSVYRARVDTTHPLLFGFEGDTVPLFKTTNMIVKSDNSPFTTPAVYQNEPLVAGYSADELVSMISNSAAIIAEPMGQGLVVGFVDNVHFRGYWYGTDKLMSNALYHDGQLKR